MASGVYIGFLTIVEVREQFIVGINEEKYIRWFIKPHLKEPTQGNAMGYYNLGVAYRRLDRFIEAEDALRKAIVAKADVPRFHYDLGLTYLQNQKPADAVSAFKETVRLDPIYHDGYFSLGLAHMAVKSYPEAIIALEKAIQATPGRAAIYRELGLACIEAREFKRATEVLRRAVALDPRDAESYLRLGKIYYEYEGEPLEAREVLMKYARLNPPSVEGFWYLGLSCLQLNRHKDALRAFKEVLRLQTEHKQAHYQLGLTYVMIGDQDSARREYSYLLAMDPDLARNLELVISKKI